MTAIPGIWEINANDSHGRLNIFSIDNQGNFMGNVTFDDAARFDVIQGQWDDAAGAITFQRKLAQTGINQRYTGFLGDNHADQLLILGGFFTQDGVSGSRTQFGWFAQQPQPPTLSPPSASIVPPCANADSCIVPVSPGDLGNPPSDTERFDIVTSELQTPLTVQWSGSAGTTVPSSTTTPIDINFNMTDHSRLGQGRRFTVTADVTDVNGVTAPTASQVITISVSNQ
ncbi:MAG: hypothetical protein ABI406_13505 [Ktedonobacteraceae bacterium]